MTVKHIVLMKFKADTPAEALEKASSNLLALKGAPPNTLARACTTARAREEGRGSRGTRALGVRARAVSPVHTADMCGRCDRDCARPARALAA